jgi:hypothetical protein
MSTYGIEVTNNAGHLLVSSDVISFHFAGIASLVSTESIHGSSQIGSYAPVALNKQQEIDKALAILTPPAIASRVQAATKAGNDALTASITSDGTTVLDNVTTIKVTNPSTGIVTVTTHTLTQIITKHPPVTAIDPKTGATLIISPAYETTENKTITVVNEGKVSVKTAAYDSMYTSLQPKYDAYIQSIKTTWGEYVDGHNAGVATSQLLNNLSPSYLHVYKISGSQEYAPLFFVNPGSSSDSYGTLRQYFSNGAWVYELLHTGSNNPPNVYVFMNPDSIPASSNAYGVLAYLADGDTTTFDSRKMPMVITDSISVSSPAIPCIGGVPNNNPEVTYPWRDVTLDFNFKPKPGIAHSLSNTGTNSNTLMCIPAVSEAVYSRIKKGYKVIKGWEYLADSSARSFTNWWVMYHQTYSISSTNLYAGWSVYSSGYSLEDSWNNLTTPPGPYADQTINTEPAIVLITDLSLYT